jgi:excinuclease ABC subunit A
VRRKGYRRIRVDGVVLDIGEEVELDEGKPAKLEVLVDTFTVKPGTTSNCWPPSPTG